MRRYWITAYVITATFLILGASVFFLSYARLAETLYDLVMSFCYYFCGLFQIPSKLPITVNDYSTILRLTGENVGMAETPTGFQKDTLIYFKLIFTSHNFSGYWGVVMEFMFKVTGVVAILAPIVVGVVILVRRLYFIPNQNHNEDTRPLKVFKWLASVVYQPIKGFLIDFKVFLAENSYIKKAWTVIWLFNFNIISIGVAVFAYYFYFALSFDLFNIYKQVVKLVIDLKVVITKIPIVFIIIYVVKKFNEWRKGIAYSRLYHMESRNCGFINELPIVSMTVGSMGKRKTTMITDMVLSEEVMLKQRAFERLQKQDMKFPYFPWIEFELELKARMRDKTVYNLATIKDWVRRKENSFNLSPDTSDELYGYDFYRYGFNYYDGLKVETVFDVLETYAQLYFIYVIECSLIVSNYSIRTDNQLIDRGNFPKWEFDFFPETPKAKERFAHILDFDVLRLGKKVIEDNLNIGSFEFGIIAITEVGKERGNNLELKEVKKGTTETNQKNDLFNGWLKMCRHSATVDNFPFIKVFTDEQRPESWGADARDLCDVIHIVKSSEPRLALPFYTIEEMITETLFNRLIALYYRLRHLRGDNTLLIHVFKTITAFLYHRHIKIVNRYGYSVSTLEKERGSGDGKVEKKKYFLANHKIYSRRFATDCFSDYFNDLARKTKVGLNDYVTYQTERATVEELKKQNSYFIRSLYGDDSD
ncbi:MAG: hypothetical protein E7360_06970 [Clostridiales bacterium]|nr:hypothetical protein [Clostridiales bacterium]